MSSEPTEVSFRGQKLTDPGDPDHARYLEKSERRDPDLLLQSAMFSGPLPPSAELGKYNEIIPNGADRIMSLAEKEQDHRHRMDEKALDGDIARDARGQRFGLTIGIAGFVTALLMVLAGYPGVAGVIGVLDLVALVSVFVLGRTRADSSQDDEEDESA